MKFVTELDHKHAWTIVWDTFTATDVTTVRNTEFSAQFGAHSVGASGSFLGLKRPGRLAEQSPLFSVKVENEWSYSSTPNVFMACVVSAAIRLL